MNNTVLKNQGMRILINSLGEVDAERFIALILEEPFDYTKWQSTLFDDKTVDELSNEAMIYVNKTNKDI